MHLSNSIRETVASEIINADGTQIIIFDDNDAVISSIPCSVSRSGYEIEIVGMGVGVVNAASRATSFRLANASGDPIIYGSVTATNCGGDLQFQKVLWPSGSFIEINSLKYEV